MYEIGGTVAGDVCEGEGEGLEIAEGAAPQQLHQIGVRRARRQCQLLWTAALLLRFGRRRFLVVLCIEKVPIYLYTYNLLEVVLPLAEFLIGRLTTAGGEQCRDELLLQFTLHQLHFEEVAEDLLAGEVVAQCSQQTSVQTALGSEEVLHVETLSSTAAVQEAF